MFPTGLVSERDFTTGDISGTIGIRPQRLGRILFATLLASFYLFWRHSSVFDRKVTWQWGSEAVGFWVSEGSWLSRLEDAEFRTLHPSSTHHVERRNANWFPFQLKRVILWLVPTIKNYPLESVKISVAQQKGGFTTICSKAFHVLCPREAPNTKVVFCEGFDIFRVPIWRPTFLPDANALPACGRKLLQLQW